MARSRRISWRAKGLLLELLSYPPDNDITLAKLAGWGATSRKSGYSAEGREALQMAMRELEREGYVVHVRRRGDRGRWETTTYVSTAPERLPQAGPSTGSPRSVDQYSAEQSSADQRSVDQSLSTCKTDDNTDKKTEGGEEGLESSSALAGARAGQQAGPQDRRREELNRLYEAANDLDDDRLRRLLLQFEKKRPRRYGEMRQKAIGQLERESPALLKGSDSVREVDLLSFKYSLQHYSRDGKTLPAWLVRFPQ
ncbi:hypothetical protein [Streptomyces lydicus]|uniref:hypothetical protein n=1 Tax=Streptomyces lydicus TaxID=47763 RepID=UPI0036E1872A